MSYAFHRSHCKVARGSSKERQAAALVTLHQHQSRHVQHTGKQVMKNMISYKKCKAQRSDVQMAAGYRNAPSRVDTCM